MVVDDVQDLEDHSVLKRHMGDIGLPALVGQLGHKAASNRAPLVRTIVGALRDSPYGTLNENFFLDLLQHAFSKDAARSQLDTAIDWAVMASSTGIAPLEARSSSLRERAHATHRERHCTQAREKRDEKHPSRSRSDRDGPMEGR